MMDLDDIRKAKYKESTKAGACLGGASDLIHQHLGFCACGKPSQNLEYILGALEALDAKWTYLRSFDDIPRGSCLYDLAEKKLENHFRDQRAQYFFYYWADKEELAEHGGGVGGEWLTDKGEQLLALLREWKTLPDSDDDD
jgi:hypothetical protein